MNAHKGHLGPTLWNVDYESRIQDLVDRGVTLFAYYTDDTTLIISATTKPMLPLSRGSSGKGGNQGRNGHLAPQETK